MTSHKRLTCVLKLDHALLDHFVFLSPAMLIKTHPNIFFYQIGDLKLQIKNH